MLVIINSIDRMFNPVNINYEGMIVFSIIGIIINLLAFYFTHGGKSINQKAVNLHMLEDVLGWVVVFIGSILMKYTDVKILDSFMSIGISLFILINAFKNLKEVLYLFLERVPKNISIDEIKEHIMKIKGVIDVHHIHVWSIDGYNNYATMHVVINLEDVLTIKKKIRKELLEHGIVHTTIETEKENECDALDCVVIENERKHIHHHH